jgi:hypothetical protein
MVTFDVIVCDEFRERTTEVRLSEQNEAVLEGVDHRPRM